MDKSFRTFLDTYLDIWRNSSINELKEIICRDYQAREISEGKIIDFGYEESIFGWEEGFKFAKENAAQWKVNELSVIPLRADETIVILSATLTIEGKDLNTANLFFQTFKRVGLDEWKLVRSYIEAGVSLL
ncbi:flavoprotein [Bacillus sp. FJAT-27225]|uniref:flavoprotein n=1 Tax=Bacillus sp. FJAT-27225 TaxID=1743144 RepID=UPI00080C2889|nr:flavoprotein [Bacillus sp. FJAT-27225]OCA90494.1 flavoprotein [Bacillus sp. FJAT-27225]